MPSVLSQFTSPIGRATTKTALAAAVLVAISPANLMSTASAQCPPRLLPAIGTPGSSNSGEVRALAQLPDGSVLVGGNFTSMGGRANTGRIARVDPATNTWSSLGLTPDNDVNAIAVVSSTMAVVGGAFGAAGGVGNRNAIARYNPSANTWQGVAQGGFLGETVYALLTLPDGRVVVGGTFDGVFGGVTLHHIAIYDPVANQFTAMGDGVNAPVRALALLPTGSLIVGGDFATAGGNPAARIARYDIASGNWAPIGAGTNLAVNALLVLPDLDVIVGGEFGIAGGNTSLVRVARCNPFTGSFSSLGAGIPNGSVMSLALLSTGEVAVGGTFTIIGNVTSRLYWSVVDPATNTWRTLQGMNSDVKALLPLPEGEVILGGVFNASSTTLVGNITRFDTDGSPAPSFTAQPADVRTCPSTAASFSVTAVGTGTLTYQWRKDAVNINTVTNPSAATATLTLASAQAADAGSYDCVVGSDCGSITSAAATLAVGEPVFTLLPTDQAACAGESVVFTCEALGNGFTYRWLRALQGSSGFGALNNNATFSGVDTNTLTIANVMAGDANETARFRVQAVSPCGTVGIPSPVEFSVGTTITTQPTDDIVCRGGAAVFTTVANGKDLTYRWARAIPPAGFLNLSDGGNISGAFTPTLTVSNITAPVNATYRCRVFSPCGNVDATLVNIIYCPADINCSGTLSVQDIFDFLAAYFSGAPAGDFNNSGTISVQDIFDFLAAYFAGCA